MHVGVEASQPRTIMSNLFLHASIEQLQLDEFLRLNFLHHRYPNVQRQVQQHLEAIIDRSSDRLGRNEKDDTPTISYSA